MFTTGSKLLIGATAISLITAIVFGITTDGPVAWMGTISLISLTAALGVVTGMVIFTRDANVRLSEVDATVSSAAAQPRPGNSMWPLVSALGALMLVIGIVTTTMVFYLAAAVLLAGIVEWMIQAWAERASADGNYNRRVRGRMLHPAEFPVLALLGAIVIAIPFSRIMLFLSKEAGPIAFIIIASVVLLAGFVFAAKPSMRRGLIGGVTALGAVALVGTGAVMAIDGPRKLHVLETVEMDPGVCLSNAETEADDDSSQTVGAKSNVAATVILEDGRLRAEVIGMPGEQQVVTLPRSNPSNIIFRNLDTETVRLTVNLGSFPTTVDGQTVNEQPVTCTQLVEQGGQQLLSLTFFKSSIASATPYSFTVPGLTDSSIEIVVP